MKTDQKIISRTYAIPLDMLMDILKIVLKNELPNHIEGINVKENVLRLNVKYPPDNLYSKETKENIETLLADYGYFTNGAPDDRMYVDGQTNNENDF